MPVIALLVLTSFWMLGTVVAMAVCRAAAQGDRTDARSGCLEPDGAPVTPVRRQPDVPYVT